MTIDEKINFLLNKAKFQLSKEELTKFKKDLKIFIEDIKVLDDFDLTNVESARKPFEKSENLLRDDKLIKNNNLNFIKNTGSYHEGYILLNNNEETSKSSILEYIEH